jgi:transmembrane sensor
MEENKNIIKDFSIAQEEQAWQNILIGIRANERKKKLRRLRIYTTVAATVVLAIFGLIGYNTFFKPDIYVAEQQNSEIKLADGSFVILSQGGKLTVEKSFPADTRDVFLEGDAIFNVTKSKKHPFIVHGKGYQTKVLGTVFKVYQTGKLFKVDLFEGKVLVYRNGHSKEPVAIQPRQTFTNYGSPNVASVTTADEVIISATEDKKATLIFDECPINDAVQVIEKTYGIKIHYSTELKNTKITITVPNATADAFIQTLGIQLNLNTRKNNDSTFELEK